MTEPPKKRAPRKKAAEKSDHEKDIKQLARNFLAAARRNGLCDVLYTEINNLNKGLKIPLPINPHPPENRFIITVEIHLVRELNEGLLTDNAGEKRAVPALETMLIDEVYSALVAAEVPGLEVRPESVHVERYG